MNPSDFGANGPRSFSDNPELEQLLHGELPVDWYRGSKRPYQIISVVRTWFEQEAPTPRKRFQRVVTKVADAYDVSESTIRSVCGEQIYDEEPDYVEKFIDALQRIESQYE